MVSVSVLCFEAFVFFSSSGSYVEIIFTENKMKQKRTDGESAKAVKEQVFLSRYKSEPGIVESSVSKSLAYCQYCCSFHRSVAEN